MAYTINHYNGTLLTTVADGTVDTTTDLTLIGKNYAGYGQAQNDNFVWLLENFASTTQPSSPVKGQIWFDSGTSKLKFYDGSKFRTTGGSELGTSAPTGLTQGDFWFNTSTNQLFAYTGNLSNPYQLIGPQAAGSSVTQLVSTTVLDNTTPTPVSHAIIQAQVSTTSGSETVFIISADSEFTLNSVNPITGFTQIQQGITLAYTDNNATPGVTTSSHRFYGTATNADQLGGLPASSFVQSGSAAFTTLVNFPDVGFTVGSPTAKLAIFNAGASVPTIQNQYSNTIVFQTTVASVTQTPLTLVGNNIWPGNPGVTNLGSQSLPFLDIYASYLYGTAQQADSLKVGTQYWTASTASSANTIVARDSSQNIYANVFSGTATSANYADLAEKYLPSPECGDYPAGTVVCVGGTAEIRKAGYSDKAIGVISTNPAFMMNKDLAGGIYVALKGRVPVKIWGGCAKGDMIAPYGDGYGASMNTFFESEDAAPICFAVALADSNEPNASVVECVIL